MRKWRRKYRSRFGDMLKCIQRRWDSFNQAQYSHLTYIRSGVVQVGSSWPVDHISHKLADRWELSTFGKGMRVLKRGLRASKSCQTLSLDRKPENRVGHLKRTKIQRLNFKDDVKIIKRLLTTY